MAGAGYKLFATGDVLSASDVNTYIMQQTVMVFASSAARTTALSSVLAEGMISYLKDTNVLEVYDGSAWVGATGDITGLTAGTGVSITSASGPVPTVAIDTAVVPQLGAANTFTGGVQQITTASAATKGLIVKATASQSANLQEWQDSTGTVLAQVLSTGRITNTAGFITSGVGLFGASSGGLATLTSYTAAAGTIGIAVRGAASQTADLQQWQDSSGTVLAKIAQNGRLTTDSTLVNYVQGNAGTGAFADFINYGNGIGIVGRTNTAATILAIRGMASQTGNLQEWQNSAGVKQGWVDSSGFNLYMYTYRSQANPTTGSYIVMDSNQIRIMQQTAGAVAFIVRGAASQTANLQEWQDSSGNVLSRITASGVVQGNIQTLNAYVRLQEESGGGSVQYNKCTSAAGSPGAGKGVLYFRDGTTAGTLKLVVRAGAAGAETTILDNIPQ